MEKYIDFSEMAGIFHIDRVEFNRDYCEFYHKEYMNLYYKNAENEIDIFWNPKSQFYKMFSQLDLSNFIDLACGHGRYVQCYCDKAEKIMLVDILQENIDYYKERFHTKEKIKYYKNDGYDLRELEANSYNALVC